MCEHAESTGTVLEMRSVGCRSWFCDRCCQAKGLDLQRRVELIVENTFEHVMMLTLTLNPAEFEDGPWAGYSYARKRVGRFIRDLRRRGYLQNGRYFSVMEVQENGWPHWHILIDCRYLPFQALFDAWNQLGPGVGESGPAMGWVRFSATKAGMTKGQAVRYVCAYLVKRPKSGWPDWILDRSSRVRRYSTSQGFFCVSPPGGGEVACGPVELEAKAQKAKPREASGETHRARMSRCGSSTIVQEVREVITRSGEVVKRSRFVALLLDSIDVCAELVGVAVDEGARLVELPSLESSVELLHGLCDLVRLKRWRASERACARAGLLFAVSPAAGPSSAAGGVGYYEAGL